MLSTELMFCNEHSLLTLPSEALAALPPSIAAICEVKPESVVPHAQHGRSVKVQLHGANRDNHLLNLDQLPAEWMRWATLWLPSDAPLSWAVEDRWK
jgi:hypothetical protein